MTTQQIARQITISYERLTRERLVNWLAVLVILSLGFVWPPAFANTRADDLTNVHAGDPLVIAARLPKVPQGVLTLSGRSGGGALTRQLDRNPSD